MQTNIESYKYSPRLQQKITSLCSVLAFSHDGTILKSNITGVIGNSRREIDSLLCQRLKAVQLLIESRHELSIAQESTSNVLLSATNALSQVTCAIASLDSAINSLQPLNPKKV